MSDDLFRNQYRIPSARAAWHDYNGGMYFVTICTQNMEHYFGEIVGGVETFHETSLHEQTIAEPTMQFSEIGRFADEQLRNVSSHYTYAEIPLWVVMPNHVHAIVIIHGDKTPNDKRGNMSVPTRCADGVVETGRAPSLRERMKQTDNCKGWLSVVVGGIKSAITKFANQNAIPFAWQPRFHDHIIRNTDEMNRIAQYIENNVAKWELDKFFN